MSPFERFGIRHLSASALNKFNAQPAAWIVQYLYKVRDNGSPSTWRGSAVEAGLNALLSGSNLLLPEAAMLAKFESEAQGEASNEVEKERAALPGMLKQAGLAFADRGRPVAMQLKTECWLDGIEVPIIGYADYVFEDCGEDLKTTFRVPSSLENCSVSHVRQAAIYMRARSQPWRLTYVSDKKFARFEIPQDVADKAIQDLTRFARSLREALRRSETADDMAALYAPDFTSFYWTELTKSAASNINAWR